MPSTKSKDPYHTVLHPCRGTMEKDRHNYCFHSFHCAGLKSRFYPIFHLSPAKAEKPQQTINFCCIEPRPKKRFMLMKSPVDM